MAAKKTIFPEISAEANALLVQVCEAQGCRPGVVVEAALHNLLAPQEVTTRETLLLQGLMQLHEDHVAMLAVLTKIATLLEAQQPASVNVAPWEKMYEQESAQAVIDEKSLEPPIRDLLPQPGGWRRAFPKREK